MANRYIPFGYEIADGEFQVVEREAETVRSVYSLYVQGLSMKSIMERLNQLGITYNADGRAWDKNMVKRLLENRKYMGDKGYPVIIPKETFELAQVCRVSKMPEPDMKLQKRLSVYRRKLRCSVCGSKMKRVHEGHRRNKSYWKCSNEECEGYRHMLSQERFDSIVALFLNEMAEKPDIIQTKANSVMENDIETTRMVNEAYEVLQSPETDLEEGATIIPNLAQLRFNCCKEADNSAITNEIEKRMLLYPPKEIPDGDVVEAVVKQIEITPNKTVYITLTNEKRFERNA